MVRAFRLNLNALGSLTLLVGIFLIANAVSIAVLRRRPEIATLRALGASRSAIFSAFLAEGLAIGVAGTLLGEVLGLFVSRAALRAVGGTVSSIYLPTARIAGVGYGGAVWLAAAVGLSAAVLATLLPAIEATRVAPSPAMRPGSIEGVARRRLWPRASGAAAALAAAAILSARRARRRVSALRICGRRARRPRPRARGAAGGPPRRGAARPRCSRASAPRGAWPRGSSAARSRATASPSRRSRWRSA